MKMFLKRSFWAMLTIYLALWLVISMVAGIILEDYKNVINSSLGLTGYRTETITTEGEDLEYFKSKYVQYDADGNILYVTDENGYTHQVYDDVALREAALEKAYQVQREGSTILWNTENGLPLAEGNKVSLFSHSSVAWVYSGFGSGAVWTSGSSDMKKAFNNAGLSVNDTLWNFYKSGEGKDYTREDRYKVNEVPWSKYTDAVKNSFASYGDAAVIVLSRRTGEHDQYGDAGLAGVDTPSGYYYDLSKEELDMINNVIELKKAGTFKKVIVLLNTPTDIWFDPLFDYKDDIDCCIWVGQTGSVGLDEVGRIFAGKSTPSGHLVDTFLMNSNSNPATVNFAPILYSNANSIGLSNLEWQGTYSIYMEGIYLGYKYYETRYEDAVMGLGNATSTAGAVNSASNWVYSEEVAFPFGYGVTYTDFQYSNFSVALQEDGNYNVTVTVTNIGNNKGQDAVQIYVQKPYTAYDKEHGIEQASVNLAGYAKTPELKPGESVTVSIIVRDDALKTYDANNAKTYIREAGDYYFVAGQDAHDAINNILAKKGYTPDNTGGVMDAAGNSSMVELISFSEDDFTTYSVSDAGVKITNQFDDVDWNKYVNNTGNQVTYLSRSDWQATYPKQLNLSLNAAMVKDLGWNKDVAINPNDKMPLYGQDRVFNLIDLKGLPYDHPSWDALLNQMTLEEQVKLLAHCYHGTKEVISVAKPAEITHDGPMGIRQKYKTNSSAYTMSYPSTTLLAASYNDELAYEVGYLMGEDMLHVGVTGIYAPGANLHRSTYSGRNYEYYSEDAFISGIMCKWQVIGIQETGNYVNLKHFVLNDSETNRFGSAVWANEQTIREVYLQAFEYSVTEGNCTGMMSAFTRLGTSWSGAHVGLLEEVLRGEWGFLGFVISDCAWRDYMGVIDGVMAGNDCVLDDTAEEPYFLAENNPTIALAIRDSVHNILYVAANSNSMNGFSSNTRIYQVDEWWQVLVKDVQTGIAIATAISFVITLLAFIFLRDAASNITEPAVIKIISTVLAIVIALAIGAGSIYVSLTLPGLPTDFMRDILGSDVTEDPDNGGTTVKPSLKDELGEGYSAFIFEAECAETTIDSSINHVGNEGKHPSATNYPSGGMFVFKLEESKSAVLTFNVTSSAAQKAVLSVNMGCKEYALGLGELFTIKVNGVECEIDPEIIYPLYSNVKYYDWLELEVVMVDLVEGNNVIEFVRKPIEKKSLNFDYIALYATSDIKWTSEINVGHTYEAWKLATEPTTTQSGTVQKYCKTCRDLVTDELPAISEANGYTKTVTDAGSANGFGKAKWSITKDGVTFSFDSGTYPDGAEHYKFEAEGAIFSGDKIRRYVDVISGASGNTYLGQVDGTTWTITLEIYSDRSCYAMFVAVISEHNSKTFKIGDGRTLTVNGKNINIPSNLVTEVADSGNTYYNWEEFEISVIELKKGKNVITFANAGKTFNNIDYFELISVGELAWYEVDDSHVHTPVSSGAVEPTCIKDGYTAGTHCSECDEDIAAPTVIPALGHNWNGTRCDRCNAVKFEAECSDMNIVSSITHVGNEGKTSDKTNYPSGDMFIYKLEESTSATLTFNVTSATAQKATFTVTMACKEYALGLGELFTIKVNGKAINVDPSIIYPLWWNVKYYDWLELEVGTIDLKEGNNVIEFIRNDIGSKSLNFDYIALTAEADVQWTSEVNVGHTYDVWSVMTQPTYSASGILGAYCETCRAYTTKVLPVISVDNGYTLVSTGVESVWNYNVDGVDYQIVVKEADKYTFDVTKDDDVFTSFVDNNGPNTTQTGNTTNKGYTSYGVFYELTQGATFTLEVNVENATEAVFILKLCSDGMSTNCNQILKSISVTNGGVTTNGTVYNKSIELPGGWYTSNAVSVELATIKLEAGKNVITFTMGDLNVNIFGVELLSFAPVIHEPTKILYGGNISEFDPFLKENGGSIVKKNDNSAWKREPGETKYGVFYQNNQGTSYTVTVTVDKTTDVTLILGFVFQNTSGYDTDKIITSITSTNANGVANTVVMKPVQNINSDRWYTDKAVRTELATITLPEGTNTITFTFGELDVNISSFYLKSNDEIAFGNKSTLAD